MGDFPHYFDIILFAMVAAFLVLRLRSVLGRRTGNERRRDPMLRRAEAPAEQGGRRWPSRAPRRRRPWSRRRRRMPSRRAGADPRRRSGVRSGAIHRGGARRLRDDRRRPSPPATRPRLRPLLSDDVYKPFAAAIDERTSRRRDAGDPHPAAESGSTSSRPASPAASRGSPSSSSRIRSMCCAPMTAASSTAIPSMRSRRPISGALPAIPGRPTRTGCWWRPPAADFGLGCRC